MDKTIKDINYRVRPPENKSNGWIDRETLKVFNGWEWIAVGADSPFHEGKSLAELDMNFHNVSVSILKGQELSFAKPFQNGVTMNILIHNTNPLAAIDITLPVGDEYVPFKADATINIPAKKYALIKATCVGDKLCINWEIQA